MKRGDGVNVHRHFKKKKIEKMQIYVGSDAIKDYESREVVIKFKDIKELLVGKMSKILKADRSEFGNELFFSIVGQNSKETIDLRCNEEERTVITKHIVCVHVSVFLLPYFMMVLFSDLWM
jgi:hypothetical protein